jgi:hypothetical protein
MPGKSTLSLAVLSTLLAGPAAAKIDIVFDYTYDTSNYFTGNATRTSLLESAASVFESRITDSLGAITPSDNNHFDAKFWNPSTGDLMTLNDYNVVANQIVIFVGAADLGSGTLGEGGAGFFSHEGTDEFFTSIRRGQSGYLIPGNDTDFAPWGGAISFNSHFTSWYFDPTLSMTGDISGYDFYSVALHEIGHVLGYGYAESWNKQINGICPACSINGKPLADIAHWQVDARSTINGLGSFEVAMDPNLPANTRKNFTDQDWAGLSAIGWQVTAVPEPETWAMLLAGLGLVGFAAARKENRRQG